MAETAQTQKNSEASPSETVTVSLKHPHGLILRLHEMVETQEAVMGGGTRTVKQARFTGQQVAINGYSPRGTSVPMPAVAGAFVMTHGISKEFWDEWVKQNNDHPYLKSGILFASPSSNHANGRAKEFDALKCGLEALDPNKLPVGGVKTYDKESA